MKHYQHLSDLFSAHLQKFVFELENKSPVELYQPANYILTLGGKRLRPLLALIGCELFDKDPSRALNSALAVELFHNFSLIHDDILDEAPLRRNQPTVHLKWNTNRAILSGDVLMVKSLYALQRYEPVESKELSALFLNTAIEVCEGQQMDMNFENKTAVGAEDYLRMITLKTAVLLGASLKMGAINAKADANAQLHIYNFGKHLGIAFQLLDDLLDTFAESNSGFGKQVGGDIIANKKTFLLIKALEIANDKQRKEIQQLLALTENESSTKVKNMVDIFNQLGVQQLCKAEADKHTKSAINALDIIECNVTKKNNLRHFANNLLSRQV